MFVLLGAELGVVRRPLGLDGERNLVADVQKMAANEVQSVKTKIGIRTTELYKIYISIL